MALSSDVTYGTLVDSSMSLASKAAFTTRADKAIHLLGTKPSQSPLSQLLVEIPIPEDSGAIPLASLGYLLSHYSEILPTFDTLRCYGKLWLGLPNTLKAESCGDGKSILPEVLIQVKATCGNLPSLFLSDSALPALIDPTTQRCLTHQQLSLFIRSFKLP